MNEYFHTLTPQERDRTMQVHLAQARGPSRNGDLLRASIDLSLRMRAANSANSNSGDPKGRLMDNALVETLRTVTDALEQEGIKYAITGSVASSVHGEPFSSLDVDLIVIAAPQQAGGLSARLLPGFYAPADMLMRAAENHEFVNVIDHATSLKVDLSFVEAQGFLAETVARRVRQPIGTDSPEFWFTTAEDVILMKLLWRRDTRSHKQWDNALSVARVKGSRMDWKYLFEQAKTLDIVEDLTALRDEAGI